MKNIIIQLETLSCPSCAAKIEGAFKRTKGVEKSEVLFNSSRVRLSFDPTIIEIDGVKKVLTTLGFAPLSIKEST